MFYEAFFILYIRFNYTKPALRNDEKHQHSTSTAIG